VATYLTGNAISLLIGDYSVTSGNPMADLGVAQGALWAVMVWVFYLAVEPYCRRSWPEILIPWARLLEGRWRDPLVGRDLLMGTAAGMAMVFADQSRALVAGYVGSAEQFGYGFFEWTLAGLNGAVAEWLFAQIKAIGDMFWLLVLLVALRMAVRRVIYVFLLFLALVPTLLVLVDPEPSLAQWATGIAQATILFWVLVRLGCLAAGIAWGLSGFLFCLPLTTDFSAWYAGYGLAGVGLIAALAVFGFYTSHGNRPLFGGGSPGRV
jgi:serine/threonine-protein kinase